MSEKPKDHGEPPGPVKWLIWLFRRQTWADHPVIASVAVVLVVCATVTGAFGLLNLGENDTKAQAVEKPELQLVVLMDSTLPEVVYDPDTMESGGTNADDISDVLDDLPIKIIKETTSLKWDRDEQVRQLDPDLIVIHLSAFYGQTTPGDREDKLELFLDFMAESRTKFILYSRVSLDNAISALMLRIPRLQGRVSQMQVPGGGAATFRDKTTARELKLLVKKVLNLQN